MEILGVLVGECASVQPVCQWLGDCVTLHQAQACRSRWELCLFQRLLVFAVGKMAFQASRKSLLLGSAKVLLKRNGIFKRRSKTAF